MKLSQRAAIAYDNGQFERALALYEEAYTLWNTPRLTLAIAKCQEALGQYQDALKTIRKGLAHKPKQVLRSRLLSKQLHIQKLLKQGRLTLLISPSGATVHIDGRYAGKAPLKSILLTAGTHRLVVTHSDYARIEQEITVVGGKSLRLRLTLQAQTGSLTVTSTPAGASVMIDGKRWGKTPLKEIKLPVGTHTVLVKTKGYKSSRKRITISPQRKENIDVVLTSVVKRILVHSAPKVWYTSWPGWTLLAVGVIAGGIGTALMIQSDQSHQSVQSALQSPETQSTSQLALSNQWKQANQTEQTGLILISAGGTTLAISAILFATGVGAAPKNHTTTTQHTIPNNTTTQLLATH